MTQFAVIVLSGVIGSLLLLMLQLPLIANGQQLSDKCMQPMEPGPCRMYLERYYYNAKTNACETFKFGGCRGNDNKFGFKQTCEEACVKRSSGANPSSSSRPTNAPIVAGGSFKSKTGDVSVSSTTKSAGVGPTTTTTTKAPQPNKKN